VKSIVESEIKEEPPKETKKVEGLRAFFTNIRSKVFGKPQEKKPNSAKRKNNPLNDGTLSYIKSSMKNDLERDSKFTQYSKLTSHSITSSAKNPDSNRFKKFVNEQGTSNDLIF
jgi:hypothetical protein